MNGLPRRTSPAAVRSTMSPWASTSNSWAPGKVHRILLGSAPGRTMKSLSLELPLVAVVNEIDARVDILIFHPGICRHICTPSFGIFADEIIGFAVQLVHPEDCRRW